MNSESTMYWGWFRGGLALGLVFLAAIALVKPIGVSTQFVILDGIISDAINPNTVIEDNSAKSGYSSPNAYLNKSGGKYARAVANPINYSFIFVISMLVGGLMGGILQRKKTGTGLDQVPQFHRERFADTPRKRYLLAFIGGVIVLWGARLAGGCTSGHMMSGMMQTAISGYAFALAAFVIAIPTAVLLYRK